ncbi:MAG: hypothetical protein KGJ83_00370 [Betaproteobacteria bacterium]|nr:hypothetical protein [Betaproteobacteria bacterium]MDE2211154.1 hypothetical protein [Betaproteobacteria bacterium]
MRPIPLTLSLLASALMLAAVHAPAADPTQEKTQTQTQTQTQTRETIYGSQIMTPQERSAYRSKMRAAKSVEEREQFRREHHEQMKERAKARGITLPDEPPARGGGFGPGAGMGPGGGMGPGPGMGPGGGMGPGPGMGPGGGMGPGSPNR